MPSALWPGSPSVFGGENEEDDEDHEDVLVLQSLSLSSPPHCSPASTRSPSPHAAPPSLVSHSRPTLPGHRRRVRFPTVAPYPSSTAPSPEKVAEPSKDYYNTLLLVKLSTSATRWLKSLKLKTSSSWSADATPKESPVSSAPLPCSIQARNSGGSEVCLDELDELSDYFSHFVSVSSKMSDLAESMYV